MSDIYNIIITGDDKEEYRCWYKTFVWKHIHPILDFLKENNDLGPKETYEKLKEEILENSIHFPDAGYNIFDGLVPIGMIDGILEIRRGKDDRRIFLWERNEMSESKKEII